jgi:hypothetical protein
MKITDLITELSVKHLDMDRMGEILKRVSPIFICVLAIAFQSYAKSEVFPNRAIVVTHATRYYNTHEALIRATLQILDQASVEKRPVFALADREIQIDPLWYGYSDQKITKSFVSLSGESDLTPEFNRSEFEFVSIGGYHSACQGHTISELAFRFLTRKEAKLLTIRLPMKAIYTGYLWNQSGQLVPSHPEDEAKSDFTIDGLSLDESTAWMSDQRFSEFMLETLRWGILQKHPLSFLDSSAVRFQIVRDGRIVREFLGNPFSIHTDRKASPAVVRFEYSSI